MPVQSGAAIFGTLLSGTEGTRPNLIPFKYSGETTKYQIPYATYGDAAAPNFKVSSKEENRQLQIVENQMLGGVRAHFPSTGFVVFDGNFADKSNHPANNLIVSVSGISSFVNSVYIGERDKEYSWSGLSHAGTNYLFMSMVEQDVTTIGRLSSRQYRDFETRSNTTGSLPVGPESSILIATYTSGVGINTNPVGKTKMTLLVDHINTPDPHGTKWFQSSALISGLTVLSPQIWDYDATSGIFSGMFHNVKYLQTLTIASGTSITTSGILGNVQSGNLNFTLFGNLVNKTIDTYQGVVGTLTIVSGYTNSGLGTNLFRNHMHLTNDKRIDGFSAISGAPLISQTMLSGNNWYHVHSLDTNSGLRVSITPKYPGLVFSKPVSPIGLGTGYPFERNTDLGNWVPTLRHKAQTDSTIYIRNFMPTGYNTLDSIETTYRIDSGSRPIELKVRDSGGNLLTPYQGFVLSSSGIHTMTTSGFPQTSLSQNLPFDLEYTFRAISGTNQYLGGIVYQFAAR